MKKKTIRFLIIILAAAGLLSLAGCSDEKDPVTATPPELVQPPVDISGPYNTGSSTFGAISFHATSPVITPFGVKINIFEYGKALDYYTVPNTPVIAVSRGIIDAIIDNPLTEGDREIQVTSLPGSEFKIIYDHVLDVRVLEDIIIEPGDTLGVVGNWNDDVRRFSLTVTTGAGINQLWYCPLSFGDQSFIEKHNLLLQEYTRQNRTPVYDSVCIARTLGP
ncbi:MAG: hypothetical protein KAR42_11430 [candidate division Zixibacteria bacterium]|nr:hypothetical protein [candidate division Zixibacteria bacterium]